ncbi:cytochrome b [Agarivorans sp. TSD2052]|uniref:cytochrome b n=1 Tax=Agarivorans sp. TSD2052 TaxID=2937286 RepID=UPI002010A1F7|nr:cytochrome b [Agarivorans sp. TSD2052]UPW17213.1 cytochrome b [Agarivorans sp. TSD2052]
MIIKNNETQFGLVSKLIHWLMAGLFIALIAIALYMDYLPRSPEKFEFFALHKALGVLALVSVFARIVWHRVSQVPAPIAEGFKLKLAHLGHIALYLLMLVMPISGALMSVSGGHDINFFDWFVISGFSEKSEGLNEITGLIHHYGSKALYVVLVGHIAAALYHHFIVKDDTLKRITSK